MPGLSTFKQGEPLQPLGGSGLSSFTQGAATPVPTPLTEEATFQAWKAKYAPLDTDEDELRKVFKATGGAAPGPQAEPTPPIAIPQQTPPPQPLAAANAQAAEQGMVDPRASIGGDKVAPGGLTALMTGSAQPTQPEPPGDATESFLAGMLGTAKSAAPTAAAIGAGMKIGARVGGPWGGVLGAVAGVPISMGVSALQGAAVEAIHPGAEKEEEKAADEHPMATFAGEMLPALVGMKVNAPGRVAYQTAMKEALKKGMTKGDAITFALKAAGLNIAAGSTLGAAVGAIAPAIQEHRLPHLDELGLNALFGTIFGEPRFGKVSPKTKIPTFEEMVPGSESDAAKGPSKSATVSGKGWLDWLSGEKAAKVVSKKTRSATEQAKVKAALDALPKAKPGPVNPDKSETIQINHQEPVSPKTIEVLKARDPELAIRALHGQADPREVTAALNAEEASRAISVPPELRAKTAKASIESVTKELIQKEGWSTANPDDIQVRVTRAFMDEGSFGTPKDLVPSVVSDRVRARLGLTSSAAVNSDVPSPFSNIRSKGGELSPGSELTKRTRANVDFPQGREPALGNNDPTLITQRGNNYETMDLSDAPTAGMPSRPGMAKIAPSIEPPSGGSVPPAEAPTAATPRQPKLPDRWGAREGAPHLGQTYNNFIEMGYDAKKAVIEASKGATYTPETWVVTALKAAPIMEAMGTTPKEILGGPLSEAAAHVHALNSLLIQAAGRAEAAIQATSANPSIENLIAQAKARTALRAVAEPADIARSSVGRAHRASGMPLDAKGRLKAIDAAERAALKVKTARSAAARKKAQAEYKKTEGAVDLEHEREIAAAYKEIPPENREKFLVQSAAPKSKFMELFYNNLMGLRSIVKNFNGNNLMFGLENATNVVAAGLGRVMHPVEGGEIKLRESGTRARSTLETMVGSKSKFGRAVSELGTGTRLGQAIREWLPISHRAENEGSMVWQGMRAAMGLKENGAPVPKPRELTGPSKFDIGYRASVGTDADSVVAMKIYGKIARTTSTTLEMTDAVYRSMALMAELDGDAMRDAFNRGIENIPAHQQAVRDDLLSVKPSMMYKTGNGNEILFSEMATRFAKRSTMSEDHWTVTALQNTSTHPLLGWTKAVNPFFRIRVNQFRNAIRYSPLPSVRYGLEAAFPSMQNKEFNLPLLGKKTLVSGELRRAAELGPGERDRNLARQVIGTGITIGSALFMKALKGDITGDGPDSPQARAMAYHLGWSPYAIADEEGNHYAFGGGAFDPIAANVGTVASMAEIVKDKGITPDWHTWSMDAGEKLALSFGKNFIAAPTMQGPAGLLDTLLGGEQGQQRFEKFGQRLAANVITAPLGSIGGIGKDVAYGLDQGTLRDESDENFAQEILNSVKVRIPKWRETVNPERDRFTGEPIQTHWLGEGVVGPTVASMLSPAQVSLLDRSPLGRYIKETNFLIGTLDDYVMAGGQKIKLTRQEYDRLNAVSGKKFFSAATAMVNNPAFFSGGTARQHEKLNERIDAAHAQAWSEVTGPNTRVGRLAAEAERKAKPKAR